MDGMLPEEPGQPALSPLDVEPTSENVRTSDAPVSSRLRSARCGSIASETNLLDHMSAQVAVGGTCPSNSGPLASPMHFHEAPASTAIRNASSNYSHSHRPEARYPVTTNGNGGGPIIQAPSGPRMLYRQDDRQSRTDDQQRSEVLTLVSDRDSGTTMAGENVTQVNGVDDMHRIVARKNLNNANRVEDDTISVSVGNYQSSNDGRRNHSYEQMHDAGNRTPLGTRAQSPRSPDMPILEPMTSAFRPIAAQETPLHSLRKQNL